MQAQADAAAAAEVATLKQRLEAAKASMATFSRFGCGSAVVRIGVAAYAGRYQGYTCEWAGSNMLQLV